MFLINFSKSVPQIIAHVFDVAFRWADIGFGVNECSECIMHVLGARCSFVQTISIICILDLCINMRIDEMFGTPRVCDCVLL